MKPERGDSIFLTRVQADRHAKRMPFAFPLSSVRRELFHPCASSSLSPAGSSLRSEGHFLRLRAFSRTPSCDSTHAIYWLDVWNLPPCLRKASYPPGSTSFLKFGYLKSLKHVRGGPHNSCVSRMPAIIRTMPAIFCSDAFVSKSSFSRCGK